MAVIRNAGFDPKEPPEDKPVPSQQSITPSPRRLTASMPAQASGRKLRPSFTAILWGCGMALWPRMLQHVHSHVDGDAVSVAALRMPAAAGPFVKAILEICAPLLVGYSARSLCSLLALTAFMIHCAAVRLADTTDHGEQILNSTFLRNPASLRYYAAGSGFSLWRLALPALEVASHRLLQASANQPRTSLHARSPVLSTHRSESSRSHALPAAILSARRHAL